MAPTELINDRPDGVVVYDGMNLPIWSNQLETALEGKGLTSLATEDTFPATPLANPSGYWILEADYNFLTKYNASRLNLPGPPATVPAATGETGTTFDAPNTTATTRVGSTPTSILLTAPGRAATTRAPARRAPTQEEWDAAIALHGPHGEEDYLSDGGATATPDGIMGRLCSTNSVEAARAACKEYAALVAKWELNQARAKALTLRTISAVMLEKLDLNGDKARAKNFTAADVVAVCKKHYLTELALNKTRFINEFRGIKARSGETIEQLAARLKAAANVVKLVSEELADDDEQRRILLSAVEARYPNLVEILQDYKTFDTVVARLKHKESLEADRGAGGNRRAAGREANSGLALVAHANYPGRGKPRDKKTMGTSTAKPADKCYNCGKLGHFSRDCRGKRKDTGGLSGGGSSRGGDDKPKFTDVGFHVALQAHAESASAQKAKPWLGVRDSAWCDEADYFLLIPDSGASNHMTFRRDLFIIYEPATTRRFVKTADGTEMPILGSGTIEFQAYNEDSMEWQSVFLTDVFYVPNLAAHLLSIRQITDKDFRVTFDDKIVRVDVPTGPLPHRHAVLAGERIGGTYRITCRISTDRRDRGRDVTPWRVWRPAGPGVAAVAEITSSPFGPDGPPGPGGPDSGPLGPSGAWETIMGPVAPSAGQGSGGGDLGGGVGVGVGVLGGPATSDSAILTGRETLDSLGPETLDSNGVAVAALATSSQQALELWHARLGHIGLPALHTLARQELVDGIDFSGWVDNTLDICEACVYGKTTRAAFPTGGERSQPTTRPLELVHSDLCGPFPVPSFRGARFYVSFIDDFTRNAWVYYLAHKSDTLAAFKTFKAAVERDGAHKIGAIRTDNGREYDNGTFLAYLAANGIKWQHSAPYSPQQNGIAERFNGTVVSHVRAMLKQAALPHRFWAEATAHAVYLYNRAPHRAIKDVTPYEKYSGRRPDLSNARIFGCDAYAYVHDDQGRRKLDDRAIKMIYLGWSAEAKAYKLCNAFGTIMASRTVTFDERRVIANIKPQLAVSPLRIKNTTPPATPSPTPAPPDIPTTFDRPSRVIAFNELEEDAADGSEEEFLEKEQEELQGQEEPGPAQLLVNAGTAARAPAAPKEVRRSGRGPAAPTPAQDYLVKGRTVPAAYSADAFTFVADASGQVIIDPVNYKSALTSKHAIDWRKAVSAEFVGLLENGTFTVEALPRERKALTGKWVLTIKTNADGSLNKFKARFVARGFLQIAGLDYADVFAPVTRYTSIRLIAAMASDPALFTAHSDVKQAYLNGQLKEELYLELPEGACEILLSTIEPGSGVSAETRALAADMFKSIQLAKADGVRVALRLHKTLYGLKQAGREWNKLLDNTLCSAGFKNYLAELCLYIKRMSTSWVLVAVYVDDLAWISNDEAMLRDCQGVLGARFTVTDLGTLSWFLGMAIKRTPGTVTIDQTAYIADALIKFGMDSCKALTSPIDVSERLTKDMAPANDDERAAMVTVPYRSAVGTLMYLAISTRPDIATAVNLAARFLENPGPRHWLAVKRIFRYLQGTRDLALKYTFDVHTNEIVGFCDADWGGDTDTRRSNTGYAFLLHGAAISWQSKAQTTVALSSSEAEYMAAGAAAREALWFRGLAEFIGLPFAGPLTIFTDSQGALGMIKSEAVKPTSKHIDIRCHFLRDHVTKGDLLFVYVPTTEMAADCLTKGLSADTLRYTRGLLGLGRVRGEGAVDVEDGTAFGAFVRGGVLGRGRSQPLGVEGADPAALDVVRSGGWMEEDPGRSGSGGTFCWHCRRCGHQ